MTRDEKGRFQKGTTGNPNGRPPRATEVEYLGVAKDVVPLERFARILERHATQAERGNIPSLGALIKLLGLDIQRVDQQNSGEITIKVIYERVGNKTS